MSFLIPLPTPTQPLRQPLARPAPVSSGLPGWFPGHLLPDDLASPGQARQGTQEPAGQPAKGDEVVTSGGIAGKVTKVADDFVVVEVSDNVELKFQKAAIAATLPKGTLKAI